MAIGALTPANIHQGSPQSSKSARIPAPVKGIDSRTMLSSEDPDYSLYAFNLIPGQYGLQVRQGYREWALGTELTQSFGVSSMIPSGGTDADASDDRLWAVTNEGIWNVTISGVVPTLELNFLDFTPGDTTEDAGWGVYTQFTSDAGNNLLFYADSKNGLFVYDPNAAPIWDRPAITGINPTGTDLNVENVVFVRTHKSSLWLFEEDSTVAWYLPEGSISGAATPFYFGSKFKNGGSLAGLFSWTINSGSGIDDMLVAISRSGDIIIYKGVSPNDADTWESIGEWFIGGVPKGHKFADDGGGDMFIVSAFGLVALGDLVKDVEGLDARLLTDANKIAPLINRSMEGYRLDNGWDVQILPSAGQIMVSTPVKNDGTYSQYVQSIFNGGWGIANDVPIQSYCEWRGNTYIGLPDNRVAIMDAVRDNVLLTPPVDQDNGDRINYSILTEYQSLGEPTQFKRGQYVRADFIGGTPPQQTSKFMYDSDLNQITNTDTNPSPTGSALWDVSLWDAAIWATGVPTATNKLQGGIGMGRTVAVASRGTADGRTTLISWDVIWNAGGPL